MTDERVRWNDAELALLAKEVIYKYGWPIRAKGVTLQFAVGKIQTILSVERRRDMLGGSQTVSRVKKLLDAAPPTPASAPLPPAIEAPPAPPDASPAPTPAPRPPAPTGAVEDVLSTWLAGILKNTVAKLLVDGDIARVLRNLQYNEVPEAQVETRPRHNPEVVKTQAKDGKEKLKVLLCGFKPHQQGIFEQTYPDLHFRFWFGDKGGHNLDVLSTKAAWADVVLFTMEATSHSAVGVVEKMKKRFVRVTGGSSSMLAALAKL